MHGLRGQSQPVWCVRLKKSAYVACFVAYLLSSSRGLCDLSRLCDARGPCDLYGLCDQLAVESSVPRLRVSLVVTIAILASRRSAVVA